MHSIQTAYQQNLLKRNSAFNHYFPHLLPKIFSSLVQKMTKAKSKNGGKVNEK